MADFQVPTHHIAQFNANVRHLAQQEKSRLFDCVMHDRDLNGVYDFFDRIGQREVQEDNDRNGDTPLTRSIYDRRALFTKAFIDADMVDDNDKLKMLYNPDSKIAQAMGKAYGRKIDDVIIQAATGTAQRSQGNSPDLTSLEAVELPNTQKLGAAELTVDILIKAKEVLAQNEVEDDGPIYFVFDATTRSHLLGDNTLTSSDYATVKALVTGEINSYMGFMFKRSERLLKTTAALRFNDATNKIVTATAGSTAIPAGATRLFAFSGMGLQFAYGAGSGVSAGIRTSIKPRPDKKDNMQILTKANFGAVRLEEERVVEIIIGA